MAIVGQSVASLGSTCGNDVLAEVVSPDGGHKAVVFQRDCGVTTAYSTQVSILSGRAKLPNQAGNIFVADFVTVQASWAGPATLRITYPAKAHVTRAAKSFQGVAVTYAISSEP